MTAGRKNPGRWQRWFRCARCGYLQRRYVQSSACERCLGRGVLLPAADPTPLTPAERAQQHLIVRG